MWWIDSKKREEQNRKRVERSADVIETATEAIDVVIPRAIALLIAEFARFGKSNRSRRSADNQRHKNDADVSKICINWF